MSMSRVCLSGSSVAVLAGLLLASVAQAGQPTPATTVPPAPLIEDAEEDAAAVEAMSTMADTAQPAGRPDGQGLEEEIVVTGTVQRGRVEGDIAPELQLDAADIQSFGAGTLGDLLEELGPQLRSARGRGGGQPVVLVNGKRVSGFREIRNLPPEALERVDVLPEEVALSYGFRADQRVINFVLREKFMAVTVELEPGLATDGGRPRFEADANFLRLQGGSRLSFDSEYEYNDALTEAERRIITPPSSPFSLGGTFTGADEAAELTTSGFAEIDPALSALLGAPTGLVQAPAAAAERPLALADFTGSGANLAEATDLTPFRTLLPETESWSIGATYNRPIGSVAATLSLRLENDDSEARLGLPTAQLALAEGGPFNPFAGPVAVSRFGTANGPLLRKSETQTGSLGVVLNGDVADWRWSLNLNYDRTETDTLIDRGLDTAPLQARLDANDPAFNPFAPDAISGPLRKEIARATTDLGATELVVTGSPLLLPAGPVATTFKAGFETRRQRASSNPGGVVQDVSLGRDQGRFQTSIDVPLTSVRDDVLAAIGDLSLNFNASLDQLSDFGALTTYGYGLNWSPTSRLRLLVSVTEEEAAPGIEQLGNPLIVTPNVRVFDLVNGETVDITRLDGGNPALTADSRRVIKLGANWKPLAESNLDLSLNFIDSRLRGQVAGFPTATPEIEAAFPERFVRDENGRLLQIDNRPVNFAGADRQELRTGLTLFQQLPPSASERAAAAARGGGRPAGAAGPPRGGARGGRGGGGRVFVSLFHTLHTINRISIRDGVPDLDLLRGSATGGRGGQPRHVVELRLGANKNGFGARMSANWQSATTVKTDPSSPLPSDGDLRFDDFGTVDLRLFVDLGQQRKLVENMPFLRGSRIQLNVENITNARLQVRNRLGEVPLGFQPDQLDPLGRAVSIQFRKVFFAGGTTAGG